MKESTGGVGDGGELGDGLDDASLIIGVHDADEFCVGAEGGLEGCGLDETLRGAGEEGYFDVIFFEGFGGAEDGVVLDACGDEVNRLVWGEGAEEGEVVAFGAAGGEDDLGGA